MKNVFFDWEGDDATKKSIIETLQRIGRGSVSVVGSSAEANVIATNKPDNYKNATGGKRVVALVRSVVTAPKHIKAVQLGAANNVVNNMAKAIRFSS